VQTRTGKSHTVFSDGALYDRLVAALCDAMSSADGAQLHLGLSFWELRGDQLVDLLLPHDATPHGGFGVIPEPTTLAVRSLVAARQLWQLARYRLCRHRALST
jgi:hypothetical protein